MTLSRKLNTMLLGIGTVDKLSTVNVTLSVRDFVLPRLSCSAKDRKFKSLQVVLARGLMEID